MAHTRGGRVVLLACALLSALTFPGTSASAPGASSRPNVPQLLDLYLAGKFDAVLEQLRGEINYQDLLDDFTRDAPAWILSADASARARRELTAATVALEVARIGQDREWKLIYRQPDMCADPAETPAAAAAPEEDAAPADGSGRQDPVRAPPTLRTQEKRECYEPLNVLRWRPPPKFIEWGCELFRRDPAPKPIERWWQLAALAVAQRSEDPQFLVGDTNVGLGRDLGEIGNRSDEILHLEHARDRFPMEMRFVLAEGIARDRAWADDATRAYRAVQNDPDVGGEALMRLGAMQMRGRDPDAALTSLKRAATATRDPYVVFLSQYFMGRLYEGRGDESDAADAYRRAAAAVPRAQSATVALASFLFRDGRRAEAQQLVRDMLSAKPRPPDPWRAFVRADDRFWPELVGRLRAEIVR